MTNFSIKDLADFSGVKQHTIRIWEQRYSFLQPKRTTTSQRTYTTEELNILLNVALLNQNGYKISNIDKMSLEEKVQVVSKIVYQQQKAIHELIIYMAKMDATGFEMVLDNCILSWGIFETIQQIILPFCDKVGLLQKGYTKNYLENIIVIKQSIKQKIHLGIEKAAPVKSLNKMVLIFSPHGEHQELPLLYLQYLLRIQGFETLHLGQQLSIESLQMINRRIKPDYIITHLVKKAIRPDLVAFVETLPKLLKQTKFVSIENDLALNESCHQCYTYAPTLSHALEFVLHDSR